MVTWFKALFVLGGGGNVTFNVYKGFPPYRSVSTAFWTTLNYDATCVVLTVS